MDKKAKQGIKISVFDTLSGFVYCSDYNIIDYSHGWIIN
jgi:hypothetical protein